ncbi:MAG: hypothetical protein MJY64_01775 [archaeon]|nr:hypothetical protein [archaeon]
MSSILYLGGKKYNIEGTILDTVININLNPDSFLFLIDGILIPSDTVPEDGKEVEAIEVASGG